MRTEDLLEARILSNIFVLYIYTIYIIYTVYTIYQEICLSFQMIPGFSSAVSILSQDKLFKYERMNGWT